MDKNPMDQILNYINSSNEIKKFINKVVPYPYKKDMKSHLLIETSKMDINKLTIAFNDGTLKYLMFRVISKQLDPDCKNCFYRLMINPFPNGRTDEIELINLSNEEQIEIFDPRLDQIESILRHLKPWKVELFNLYYKEGLNQRQISEKIGLNERTIQRWISEIREIIKKEIK